MCTRKYIPPRSKYVANADFPASFLGACFRYGYRSLCRRKADFCRARMQNYMPHECEIPCRTSATFLLDPYKIYQGARISFPLVSTIFTNGQYQSNKRIALQGAPLEFTRSEQLVFRKSSPTTLNFPYLGKWWLVVGLHAILEHLHQVYTWIKW